MDPGLCEEVGSAVTRPPASFVHPLPPWCSLVQGGLAGWSAVGGDLIKVSCTESNSHISFCDVCEHILLSATSYELEKNNE